MAGPIDIHWEGRFEKFISSYSLFKDIENQIPNDRLIPYDLITPLFTDYADKDRFLYLPPNTYMTYDDYSAFEFPVGAALVKTFSYPVDFRQPELGRRLIETRLLLHTDDGWKGAAYVWNSEHTDARLKVAGAVVDVDWIHHDGSRKSTEYLVPNMNECKYCHRGTGTTGPIGLTARQLNRPFSHADNQLAHWKKMNLLKDLPEKQILPKIAQWDQPDQHSVEDRALGYLDIHCAHCHNPEGLASYTRLDLTYTQTDPHMRGIMKTPTSAGNSSRGRYFAIVPGNPEASFLLHRLNSTAPHIRMPQIGRTMIHEEGVQLIADWIKSLDKQD
jgi:uncharacterized repeat protein (TIGR03806 family)